MAEKVFTSEAGHWYKPDGTPAYTYINKKGEEKNTTLREARKFGWFPSVTGIIDLQMKWGLVNWKIDQNIMSALTITRKDGETEADFVARIKEDAQAQAEKAAMWGKQIHAWVQEGFEGKPPDANAGLDYFLSAQLTLFTHCGAQNWICEKPFASILGYGGKVDLQTAEYVIDIKTTDKDLANIQTWPDHAQQLAAYDAATAILVKYRKCGILYINVNTAESKLIWISSEDLQQGFECFVALLAFWKAKNKMVI